MTDLRERVAALIDSRAYSHGREKSALYAPDRQRALELADRILSLPEIADGLAMQGLP